MPAFPGLQEALAEVQVFLADGRNGIVTVAGLAVLALLFLLLWLRARSAGGDAALRKELKAAKSDNRLLKGDLMQAARDHAAALARQAKELDTLRALTKGEVPPELQEWRRRALEAEELAERQRKHVQILEGALGGGGNRTLIPPGAQSPRERLELLERELTEARQRLEAMAARHRDELALQAERLGAEKAAALTAQGARHAAELKAAVAAATADRGSGASDGAAAALPPKIDLEGLEAEGEVPAAARFAFLEVVAGEQVGERFYLPYGPVSIGRDEGNTIPVADKLVSRHHADVLFDGVDFRIRDNDSTNGTFLNNNLVSEARLDFGDVIGIGELRMRFACVAKYAAATGGDPTLAAAAYRAMLRVAPNFRLALRDLAELVGRDPAQIEEGQDLLNRLAALAAA